MQRKRWSKIFITAGIAFVAVSGIALAYVQTVYAQCGSQASSCKNCHEVQAKDPVNSDGKPWHQTHAFGDFCYICHGGNNQATDEAAAHTGMVDPLSDVKASCQSCHPSDYQTRAQVYATTLGVTLSQSSATASSSSASPAATAPTATPAPASTTGTQTNGSQPVVPQEAGVAPNDKNLVDYVQRYDQNVLGQKPTNWGNVILIVMIAALLIGGGSLVLHREGLVSVSFRDTRPVTGEYPADVVDMVPQIARLKPNARKSLRRLLEKPEATAEVLTSIDKLTEGKSPEDEK